MYGRAKALLGLVKMAKYGTGKFARGNAVKSGVSEASRRRGLPAEGPSKSSQIRELLNTGMSPSDIAKRVGCTVGLVYNVRSTGAAAAPRGPDRPSRVASSRRPSRGGSGTSLDGLADILAAVKNSERERMQMRTALERIQTILAGTLS